MQSLVQSLSLGVFPYIQKVILIFFIFLLKKHDFRCGKGNIDSLKVSADHRHTNQTDCLQDPISSLQARLSADAGKSYGKGRLTTVDLLVLTSLDQLFLY
jgi:hypothetical protein